jgi:hypothetical protein
MKLGAEPRKVAVLAGLMLLAGYLVYNNIFSDQGVPAASQPPVRDRATPRASVLPEVGRPVPRSEPRTSSRAGLQEFRPSLKPRKEEERGDLSSIDPTLRLDLLVRLQDVELEGGDRSLFEFGAAPMPKNPEPKIIPKPAADLAKELGEGKKAEPVKPPPPPIPLRFYGYTTQARQGLKRAFFLDGEDILVASEGEVMKKRYKVVRIGVNSVVVEDLQHKHEQTLPLVAEAG